MFVPPVFKVDAETAWAFVAARGFGTLVVVDQDKPVASHLPFLLDRSGPAPRLELHVAKANPVHDIITRNPNVLVTVMGPDAYISPDWYVAKDQVPTWTYVSVHLTGVARPLAAEAAVGHSDRLSAAFEARLAPKRPWTSSKMTPAKRAAMLSAIVAFEIDVTGLEAQWKLAQHKPRADRHEVVRMLQWRGDPGSVAIAELMAGTLKPETMKQGA
jgi:transcriptional regulator